MHELYKSVIEEPNITYFLSVLHFTVIWYHFGYTRYWFDYTAIE